MNLLFVYIQAVNPIKGGTERVTWCVARALEKMGHSIFFLATHSTKNDKHFTNNPKYILIDEQANYEERKQKVITTCHELQIDVVINECAEFGLSSIFSNKVLNGVKVITCTHLDIYGLVKYFHRANPRSWFKRAVLSFLSFLGIQPYYFKFYRKYKKIFKEVVQVSDAVVVVTPVIAEELQRFTGEKSAKIVSILNPLTAECKTPNYNSELKEKMLLYAGRLSHTKNVDLILLAWKKISLQFPDWKLEIAGEGEERMRLLSLVERYKIPRVHFHGQVSNLDSLYSRAEYLLLASDCESFSCVVLESMAYGCHPIVFDYPSAPIVIPDSQLGTRVKRHSLRAFTRAITNAISTGVSNRNIMYKIDKHLSQFDIDKLAYEWQLLLEQITTSNRRT